MPATVIKMAFNKETRRTYRFDAKEAEGKPPPHVANIYIDKAAFDFKKPAYITVTVEVSDSMEDY